MSTETAVLLTVLAMMVLGSFFRLIAPAVKRQWPESWIDKLIAFLIQITSNVAGGLLGLLKGQGTTSPLVQIDDETKLAMAKALFEAKELAKARFNGDPPSSARSFDDLPPLGQAAYCEAVEKAVSK